MAESVNDQAIPALAQEFATLPTPTPMLELIEGSMSVLRLGPVTIQLYSMAKVSATSAMLLYLRRPRVEVQMTSGTLRDPDWCEIDEIRIGDKPLQPSRDGSLGLIWPDQALEVVLVNTSKAIGNACVVVEGDSVRVVHWGLECRVRAVEGHDCPDCRWHTPCHHEACERVPETAQRCEEERQDAELSEMWRGLGRRRLL